MRCKVKAGPMAIKDEVDEIEDDIDGTGLEQRG
jgi:hypothetical protein